MLLYAVNSLCDVGKSVAGHTRMAEVTRSTTGEYPVLPQ